jgi:hypothetical protein
MMPMQYTGHIYADAVNYAMMNALNAAPSQVARVRGLWELLYELAQSIPLSWQTSSRVVLERREASIDCVITELSVDLGQAIEPIRYHVLSSVLLVALTIKQMTNGIGLGSRDAARHAVRAN